MAEDFPTQKNEETILSSEENQQRARSIRDNITLLNTMNVFWGGIPVNTNHIPELSWLEEPTFAIDVEINQENEDHYVSHVYLVATGDNEAGCHSSQLYSLVFDENEAWDYEQSSVERDSETYHNLPDSKLSDSESERCDEIEILLSQDKDLKVMINGLSSTAFTAEDLEIMEDLLSQVTNL